MRDNQQMELVRLIKWNCMHCSRFKSLYPCSKCHHSVCRNCSDISKVNIVLCKICDNYPEKHTYLNPTRIKSYSKSSIFSDESRRSISDKPFMENINDRLQTPTSSATEKKSIRDDVSYTSEGSFGSNRHRNFESIPSVSLSFMSNSSIENFRKMCIENQETFGNFNKCGNQVFADKLGNDDCSNENLDPKFLKNPVAQWLKEIGLGIYIKSVVVDQGYDSFEFFKKLSKKSVSELNRKIDRLSNAVNMKLGHSEMLIYAITDLAEDKAIDLC